VGLTWYFLRKFFNESFAQNYILAEQVEALKLQLRDQLERTSPELEEIPLKAAPKKAKPAVTKRVEPSRIDITPDDEDEMDEIFFSGGFSVPRVPGSNQPQVEDKIDARHRNLGKIIQGSIERIQKRHGTPDMKVEALGLEDLQSGGEESQLKTVIEEILKNAFEAVADTQQKTVTVFAEKLPEFVRVSISDTGPGVAPQNLTKVFEPFFTTKPVNGVARGLGLNVVKRVSEDFNGRVQIFSEGRGTRVELEIPMDVAKGLPHIAQAEASDGMGMLNLDFDEIENRQSQSKPLPQVNIRKPKVRALD
jgi:signal transduction histidine kinase